MNRVMLDLETLSLRSDATIVSIGAVYFDPTLGVSIEKRFHEVVARGDQTGRHIDPSVVDWWVQQGEEARSVFKAKPTEPDLALARFSAFLGGDPVTAPEVWSHGANFDVVVLRSLYDVMGITAPWSFRGDRCYRTLQDLGKRASVKLPERQGTHHNALDDAVYQAECAVAILRDLGIK